MKGFPKYEVHIWSTLGLRWIVIGDAYTIRDAKRMACRTIGRLRIVKVTRKVVKG